MRSGPTATTSGFINLPATNTDPRFGAQGDLHREGLHADHQPGADPGVVWVGRTAPTRPCRPPRRGQEIAGNVRAATTGILSDDHLAILMAEEAAPGRNSVSCILKAALRSSRRSGRTSTSHSTMSAASSSADSRARCGRWPCWMVRSKFLPDVHDHERLGFPTVISSRRAVSRSEGMPAPLVAKLRDVSEGDGRPRARKSSRSRASPSRS